MGTGVRSAGRLGTASVGVALAFLGACASEPPGLRPCRGDETAAPLPLRRGERSSQVFAAGDLGCVGAGELGSAALGFVADAGFDPSVPLAPFVVNEVVDEPDASGRVLVRLGQAVGGVAVEDALLTVQVDEATGRATTVSGSVALAPASPDAVPALDGQAALFRALTELGLEGGDLEGEPALTYVTALGGRAEPTWVQEVAYVIEDDGPQRDRVFASIADGRVVDRQPQIHRALVRAIYHAGNSESVSYNENPLARDEGGPAHSDSVVNDAYTHAALAYDYFHAVHGRDSYDGKGATVRATVHYGNLYLNAFWNGSGMFFGDGIPVVMRPMAVADITVHEFTHGVTGNSARLVYQGESGALNESFSDVFAAAATSRARGGALDWPTWAIGEDVGHGWIAIRFMADPSQAGDPDSYVDRYVGDKDAGGVHINSAIGNLAFSLVVRGGLHPRERTCIDVPALGMERAEAIWYRALTQHLAPRSDFQAARCATVQAAAALYGDEAARSVSLAWDAVEVPACQAPGETPAPTDCTSRATFGECVRTYRCGWCDGRCLLGTETGADGETCAAWTYDAPDECTAPAEAARLGSHADLEREEGLVIRLPFDLPRPRHDACGDDPKCSVGPAARGRLASGRILGAIAGVLVLGLLARRRRGRAGG